MKLPQLISLQSPRVRALVFAGLARGLAALGIFLSQIGDAAAYASPIAISTDDTLIWAVNPRDVSVSVIPPDTIEVLTA